MTSVWIWSIWIFLDPYRVFGDLKEKWPWLPAYGVAVVCATVSTTMTLATLYSDLENGLLTLTDQALMEAWGIAALVFGMVLGSLVSPIVITFLISFVASFLGVAFRRYPTYGQVFSLTIWSLLPSLSIGALLRATLPWITSNPGMRFTLSPAVLLSADLSDTITYRVLSSLDVFQVWSYVLFALGYACITGLPLRQSWKLAGIILSIQVFLVVALFAPKT